MRTINSAPAYVKVQKIQVQCILMFKDRIGYVTIKVIMTKHGQDES